MEKRESTSRILKGIGMAARLGLAGILGASAIAEAKLTPSATGLGYRQTAASMSYEQVIKDVSTPEEARFYRDNYLQYESDKEAYGQSDYMASFRKIHSGKKDDCDGVALAMAALLSDDGYEPTLLQLKAKVPMITKSFANRNGNYELANKETGYHTDFVYKDKKTGKWGCIGVSRTEDRDAQYDTLEDLAKSLRIWGKRYEVNTSKYPDGVQNLDEEYERKVWIDGNSDLLDAHASKYNPDIATYMMDEIRKAGNSEDAKQSVIGNTMKQKQLNSRRTAEYNYDIAQNALRDLAIKAQSATNVAAK